MTGDLSMDRKPQVIENVAEKLKSKWTVLYFTMCCIRDNSLCARLLLQFQFHT